MMLAQAGKPLGHNFVFVDPSPGCPAASEGEILTYSFDDESFVDELCKKVDLVTYEFENVNADILEKLGRRVEILPNLSLLAVCSDRLTEKQLFESKSIKPAPFMDVASRADAIKAGDKLGFPFVLKTRRFGYDGKGQVVVRSKENLSEIADDFFQSPLIAEAFIEFDREVSIISCRGKGGEFSCYPLTENFHKEGVLRWSKVDGSLSLEIQNKAYQLAKEVADQFDYVGTFAIEFFLKGSELIVNELAPRVHNSGHWTQHADLSSQFENHIRAITGDSLGGTDTNSFYGMINILSEHSSFGESSCDQAAYFVTDYKKSARPGRKLGHINIAAHTANDLNEILSNYQSYLK